jgi:hypothetical protein
MGKNTPGYIANDCSTTRQHQQLAAERSAQPFAKGPREIVSIESRSKSRAEDRYDRDGVIYVRRGRRASGAREVAAIAADHG